MSEPDIALRHLRGLRLGLSAGEEEPPVDTTETTPVVCKRQLNVHARQRQQQSATDITHGEEEPEPLEAPESASARQVDRPDVFQVRTGTRGEAAR